MRYVLSIALFMWALGTGLQYLMDHLVRREPWHVYNVAFSLIAPLVFLFIFAPRKKDK